MQRRTNQISRLSPDVAKRSHVAVITSQFNAKYTASLQRQCIKTLTAAGMPAKHIETFAVPGALEIPVVAKRLALSERYQVLVALGVILKGETYHFELVANVAARGCQQVALDTGVPVIMEVLACYTEAQAVARCGNDNGNKGITAANAAVAMLNLLPRLEKKQT